MRDVVTDILSKTGNRYRSAIEKSCPEAYAEIQRLPGKTFSEKLYRWLHGDPSCLSCGSNELHFINLKAGFCKYCSTTCSNSDAGVKQKKATTLLATHGVTNPAHVNPDKRKRTNLDRYGVENPAQNAAVKEKIKTTNIDRYGHVCSLHGPEIRTKTDLTFKTKFGGNPLANEHIQEKRKKTNTRKYGTEHPVETEHVRTKIRRTVEERYGVSNASQKALKESGVLDKLLDADWLREQHITLKKDVFTIQRELGITSYATVTRYMGYHGIDQQYYRSSYGQEEISAFLEKSGVPHKKNDKKSIAPYELDINAGEIAIEYCGVYWHSDAVRLDPYYHYNKYKRCLDKGIQLLTLYESEWIHKREIVERKLLSKFGMLAESKVNARSCDVITLAPGEMDEFLNKTHIQGTCKGSIRFGLWDGRETVAVMMLRKKNSTLLLDRFATNCVVRGGFTKLLTAVERAYPSCEEIVTFADNRWDTGGIYLNNGFAVSGHVRPDYRYVIDDQTYHKFNFRKHKIAARFGIDMTGKTEREAMRELGIPRIYDCGKTRYTKTIQNKDIT